MRFEFSLTKGREAHPLEALRRKLTRGLEVAAAGEYAHRGGEVEILVTIATTRKLGDVEAGIVCSEYYDEKRTTTTNPDGSTSTGRTTSDEIAYESWSAVETVAGVQSLRFTIPQDAPFSYEGNCLSFRWEAVARGRRTRRLDTQARSAFTVLP
jgi:hypothetical protein